MSKQISWQDYQAAKQASPKKFSWQLAEQLGVSEAGMHQACIGHGVQRLQANPMKLLTELGQAGNVLAVTGNYAAVNEIIGSYRNPRIGDSAGMFLNPRELDLRVFPKRWVSIFALEETLANGDSWHSIQFFDEAGRSVHRIYANKDTDKQLWQQLIDRYTKQDTVPLKISEYKEYDQPEQEPTATDVEQYWRDMVDVHQFPGLLKTFGLSRQQAFAMVGDDLARQVSNDSASTLLHQAYQAANDIMVFTGSQGCVQIYTGRITHLSMSHDWLNLSGNQFSCHLLPAAIADSWVVKKPTRDGFVTSLEVFDAQGMQISQFYGARLEGQQEQAVWLEQVDALE